MEHPFTFDLSLLFEMIYPDYEFLIHLTGSDESQDIISLDVIIPIGPEGG
jgi:hypothetical protein